MKGQFFIIASILILISFIVLRGSIGIFDTLSERRFVESNLAGKQIKNIMNEYRYLSGIASLQANVNQSARDYLHNFSTLLRSEKDIEILYVYGYMNSSADTFSINVGNFLNDKLNITLNASNSTPGLSNFAVDDKKNSTSHFSATANTTINITMTYTRIDTVITERFSIDSRKDMAFVFYDITLLGNNRIRVKDIYNFTFV